MAKSKMWKSVIEELTANDCIGSGFPIVCHRHPDRLVIVDRPGLLPQIAPDGERFLLYAGVLDS